MEGHVCRGGRAPVKGEARHLACLPELVRSLAIVRREPYLMVQPVPSTRRHVERWPRGRRRRFAKPLYGLKAVSRVRIPPSPLDVPPGRTPGDCHADGWFVLAVVLGGVGCGGGGGTYRATTYVLADRMPVNVAPTPCALVAGPFSVPAASTMSFTIDDRPNGNYDITHIGIIDDATLTSSGCMFSVAVAESAARGRTRTPPAGLHPAERLRLHRRVRQRRRQLHLQPDLDRDVLSELAPS